MEIKQVKTGELRTICYIVKDGNGCLVIDPGFEHEKILKAINGVKVKEIILTHGHYDHLTESYLLKEKVNAPISIHRNDLPMMEYTIQKKADKFISDGDLMSVGHETFKVIHTPGHTPGSLCLYNEKEKILISGDTLFYGTYGRTDLPGSSPSDMIKSLHRLFTLPKETVVLPGHGRSTTIGDEMGMVL